MTAKPAKPTPGEVLSGLKPRWHGSMEALARCWDSVLDEMLTLFYPPFRASDDVEMLAMSVTAIRAYAEDLAGYPEAQLRRAWREVRRNHKTERWPTINAILEAIGSDRAGVSISPSRYREATAEEQDLQRIAYGEVRMPFVRACDVAHHRRDAERRKNRERGGYNPFAAKVSA